MSLKFVSAVVLLVEYKKFLFQKLQSYDNYGIIINFMCAPSLSMQLILCVPNKRSEDCPKSLPPASGVLPYLKMMRDKDDSSTDSGISKGIHKITIFGVIISKN